MKSFVKFLLIAGLILLLSAVLAPVLFRFLPFKFERIFNRLVMIGTLIAVVLFVRVRRSQLESFGILWKGQQSGLYFLAGFGTALFFLTVLMSVKFWTGHTVWSLQDLSVLQWTGRIVMALGAACLIGVIEEFFFRGFIFSTLYRSWAWNLGLSVLLTNVFYSLLHFINATKPFVDDTPTPWDSVRLMGAPFSSLLKLGELWPEVLGLFLLGLILNDLVIRSRSLYPAIGLHAGCVFFVKMDGGLTFSNDQSSLIFTSGKIYDGALGWFFLFVIGFFLRRLTDHIKQKEDG